MFISKFFPLKQNMFILLLKDEHKSFVLKIFPKLEEILRWPDIYKADTNFSYSFWKK